MLTEGFSLDEAAVTQDLWFAVLRENPSYFSDEKKPVESMNWDSSKACI